MGNNNVINGPSYYTLKDGTQLEDALWEVDSKMSPPLWDACIYHHRAGHKDGEPFEKDMAKVDHYVKFLSRHAGLDEADVYRLVLITLDRVYRVHGNPWEE